MADYPPVKRGSAATLYLALEPRGATDTLQVNPTIVVGDVKISQDGGAFTNLATLPTVVPAGGRQVKVDLSAAETNFADITLQFVDQDAAQWKDLLIPIRTVVRTLDELASAADMATALSNLTSVLARLPSALTGAGYMKADALVVSDKTGFALTSAERSAIALAHLVYDLSTITSGEPRYSPVQTHRAINPFDAQRNGATVSIYRPNATVAYQVLATLDAAAIPVVRMTGI